jgi:hypothetical protein
LLYEVGGKVTLEVRDGDGALVDPSGDSMTARILNGAGAEHVASASCVRESTGVYSLSVTGAQAKPFDDYVVEWSGTVSGNAVKFRTAYSIVAGHLATVYDVRQYEPDLTEARYPAALVRERVDLATERMLAPCMYPLARAGVRATLKGTGATGLALRHVGVSDVYSVKVDGSTLSDYEFTEEGILWTPQGFDRGAKVEVHYAAGYAQVPEPVRHAACMLTVDFLIRSAVPLRATSQSTDVGAFRFTVAGRDGFTGLPEVDEVIREFGKPRAGWMS